MLGDAGQRLRRIGQRQQVIEVDAAVRRPGEMLGEALRLIAVAKRFQSRQMVAIERLHRADRQSDAMDRQSIALAQRARVRMRWSAGAHIVFRMHLEEADRLRGGENVAKMHRLEADAGARRKILIRCACESCQSAYGRRRRTARAMPAPLSVL